MADPVVPPPPTHELGSSGVGMYGNSSWWTSFDNEETPELRWPISVWVYDRMRRTDAQIAAVLRAVTLPVRRTTWRLEPNGARDEVVEQIASDLNLPIVGGGDSPLRSPDRFSWDEHLRLALLMLPFGHSFFEQVCRIDDSGRVRLQRLGPRLPRTITAIQVATNGDLVAIEQLMPDGGVQIPASRLVAYVNDREGPYWQGTSLLRPAYKHWLLKDRLLRVQVSSIERNGMGVPVYTAAQNETDLTAGQKLASSVRTSDSGGAAIPNGATLTLQGVQGRLPDTAAAIQYHDDQIARAVLAHFLNLGQQTGSWALGSTFADFFTLSLQAVAEQVADTANEHIVEDLVDWNWGRDEPAPRIVFDEIGSRVDATAIGLQALVNAGLIFPDRATEEALRQMYGLPPKAPQINNPSPTA